jgi:hypothetical protein
VLCDTFIILDGCMISSQESMITSLCESLAMLNMGKGGKRLQTTNQEIEPLQQDVYNSLQEIHKLQKKINP